MFKSSVLFLIWVLVAVHCFVFFMFIMVPMWILTAPFDKKLRITQRLSAWWALSYIYWNPNWSVTITGEENIEKGRTYVVVVNHQSALDIALLYRIPVNFRWVAKAELMRVPFIGWNLVLNRHVMIARGNATSARHMIDRCVKTLNGGVSMMIFPEGTRSKNGRITRFKEGAFVIARDANVAILPVLVEGTSDALPRDGYKVKARQHFTIRILPVVEQATLAHLTTNEVAAHFQKEFVALHQPMRPELYS
ncbi:lysophospholipid acyltransferase family protein [Williamwhitmania taraxaci]|uniref:1-acyl-sn-glycerol-3-phosphate acyltransferase n=1 Tax=Williamwhitmania taraxaci TaxID=1640674 RepID=A0A1G6I3I6_9BACT|nr:lysophospholipid acyltransferase family protein [Williamwhitmania taraxaci]SDC00968.1 1-acyl-sn-glycerol-3-phosphate acyltransferase [Williamwhitmania taraxaci]